MTVSALAAVWVVLAAGSPAASKSTTPPAYEGKVVPLVKLLDRLGAKADPDTAGVALATADGTVYTLVKDDASRLLFVDPNLHDRTVRLTARLLPGTRVLVVEKVQTVKVGKVYDVDYWCENCQLAATEPGKCKCCGGDTVLRELPAK
jgi:hypothetical protein